MSSTGRTLDPSVGDGREAHFTPPWVPLVFSEALVLPGGRWLECMAGEGHLIRGFNLARSGGASELSSDVVWTASDVYPPCEPLLRRLAADVQIGDVRQVLRGLLTDGEHFDVGVTNPAFSLAFDVTVALLDLCEWVVILQRSPWPGDDETRLRYFQRNMPDEYRLGRVSFDRQGSDSVPCSMFVWGQRAGDGRLGNTGCSGVRWTESASGPSIMCSPVGLSCSRRFSSLER